MARPAIIATASAVPPTVRTNDDPIFDWLHAHEDGQSDLFKGYRERRVLAGDEQIADLMTLAAAQAIRRASLRPGDIDLLIGYASVGTWAMPNDLVTVAVQLGLPATATILPVNNDYANYNQGIVLADALIAAGRARNALVVVASNWSRHVDYHTAPSISVGDGAGAAVITSTSDSAAWRLRDVAVDSDRRYYGGMFVAADATTPPIVPPTFGAQVFHLTELGVEAYQTFGISNPPVLVKRVLDANGLRPSEIAFIGHQSSSVLNDAWKEALKPAQYLTTLVDRGNMTAANIPVTFDTCSAEIATNVVALAALGPEPSSTVVLLERGA